MIKVNLIEANKLLVKAFKEAKKGTDTTSKEIESVLKGDHLTYRYILFTALVSKATEPNIDALSLQAKDTVDGAYNARDVAHKVVVPFERKYLEDCLGGSNEPYLNKPARFVRISEKNAVRSGKNRQTLLLIIKILNKIRTKKQAYKYLCSAIYTLKEIKNELEIKFSFTFDGDKDISDQQIFDYCNALVEESFEGEILPIIIATVEELCDSNKQVNAHKVNESGASSKEIGDIDIFDGDKLFVSIEAKDKDFTKEDVEHAIRKFIEAGLTRSLFIYGKKSKFDKTSVYQLAARYGRNGHFCCVLSIIDYLRHRLLQMEPTDIETFANKLLAKGKSIYAKDGAIQWIKYKVSEVVSNKN